MNNRYYCSDCGAIFDESDSGTYTEIEGEGVMRGEIHYMCCPECGSDSLEDAAMCEYCGEWFREEELERDLDGEYICEECKRELMEKGEWDDGYV